MREARGFQINKNTPKQQEGRYRRSAFDEKAVGEAWKRVKEYRKRILRLNQNHLHVRIDSFLEPDSNSEFSKVVKEA